MSLLSAECDELRKLALELIQFVNGGIVNGGSFTPEEHVMLVSSVDAMREAADTIENLRDKMQADAWGSGTCENIAPDYLDFLCSKCGFVHYHSDENDTGDGNEWNFCPNCGAKVRKAVGA